MVPHSFHFIWKSLMLPLGHDFVAPYQFLIPGSLHCLNFVGKSQLNDFSWNSTFFTKFYILWRLPGMGDWLFFQHFLHQWQQPGLEPGNTKGGSIIVLLTSCLTGLDWSVLQIKTKIVSCHRADPKLVKQEVNGTVILPPLVFPAQTLNLPMMRQGLCLCAWAISWHQFKNL